MCAPQGLRTYALPTNNTAAVLQLREEWAQQSAQRLDLLLQSSTGEKDRAGEDLFQAPESAAWCVHTPLEALQATATRD